jgi:hypothetical protein
VSEPASEREAAPPEGLPEAPAAPETPAPVQVRLRRAPRYGVFVATGAVLGAVAGIVARLLLGDPASVFSAATTTGYLAAIGLLLGGLFGGAVAVLVDRPHR